ncbi:MAG: GAF domain-containing protein, partial [Actinomycetota bacterium]
MSARPSPDACDAEIIEAPGCIQPHAALLCLDGATFQVLAASANLAALAPELADNASELVGLLPGTVDEAGCDLVVPARICPPHGGWAFAHRRGDVVHVEIEPLAAEDLQPRMPVPGLHAAVAALGGCAGPEEAAALLARHVRAITGMERVLVYRLEDSGDGEVVAEAVAEGLDSFLHFHFPAADIPARARDLYRRSPARFAPSRAYRPVALEPAVHPGTGQPFDIGACFCRSLSPVHRDYLANLGVDGSLSLSIVEDGRLWGLVIGHHRQPHRVPIFARHQALTLAAAFAIHVGATERARERDLRALHQALRTQFLRRAEARGDLSRHLVDPAS